MLSSKIYLLIKDTVRRSQSFRVAVAIRMRGIISIRLINYFCQRKMYEQVVHSTDYFIRLQLHSFQLIKRKTFAANSNQ